MLIECINRDYCKKLVLVLAGQQHPSHRHMAKEETFHLLMGDLEVTLDGERVRMTPGDTLLVPRGTAHAFSSQAGAIFEEVSTRSTSGDSFYDDERIQRLDPIERKTILDSW